MLEPPKPFEMEEEFDELFKDAVAIVCQYDRASASLLQRRLSIGYARAARMMDQLEKAGVVGQRDGAKPQKVLIHSPEELSGSENNKARGKKNPEEDPFSLPKDYRVPKKVTLSKIGEPAWEPQFADTFKLPEVKETKVPYPIVVGLDEKNNPKVESLLDVGSMIVVGNPLSHKEVFIDNVLLTFLLRHAPSELRFVLVDEGHYLDLYNGVPHLLAPVITEHGKTISALRWAISEMQRRMKIFSQAGVREIESYNAFSGNEALPQILMVLFLTWPDIETTAALNMLTSSGIRTGIHNFIVVDRMDSNSFPKEIKSNVPARLVFKVTSAGESRAADVKGAENLKPGEAIYKANSGEQMTLKTVFTPDVNVKEVVDGVKKEV